MDEKDLLNKAKLYIEPKAIPDDLKNSSWDEMLKDAPEGSMATADLYKVPAKHMMAVTINEQTFLLQEGIDYTIDYDQKIITFLKQIATLKET